MKYMRIAFCGASGTGKTTLARHLAEILDLPINPIGSRSVAQSLGFDNPYDVDRANLEAYHSAIKDGMPLQQAAKHAASSWAWADREGEPNCRILFQEQLLRQKITWELEHHQTGFITDRTTVDNFVYTAMHSPVGLTTDYMERAAAQVANYDIIFFTPCDAFHSLGGDAYRVSDIAYHYAFELFCDGTLVNWLGNEWNEKVRHVTEKALPRRQSQVMQFLGLDTNGGAA